MLPSLLCLPHSNLDHRFLHGMCITLKDLQPLSEQLTLLSASIAMGASRGRSTTRLSGHILTRLQRQNSGHGVYSRVTSLPPMERVPC